MINPNDIPELIEIMGRVNDLYANSVEPNRKYVTHTLGVFNHIITNPNDDVKIPAKVATLHAGYVSVKNAIVNGNTNVEELVNIFGTAVDQEIENILHIPHDYNFFKDRPFLQELSNFNQADGNYEVKFEDGSSKQLDKSEVSDLINKYTFGSPDDRDSIINAAKQNYQGFQAALGMQVKVNTLYLKVGLRETQVFVSYLLGKYSSN